MKRVKTKKEDRLKNQKQKELPGMPKPDQLQLDGEQVVSVWEELQDKTHNYKIASDDFMKKMKKANKIRVIVNDSTGTKRIIEYGAGKESIRIKTQSKKD